MSTAAIVMSHAPVIRISMPPPPPSTSCLSTCKACLSALKALNLLSSTQKVSHCSIHNVRIKRTTCQICARLYKQIYTFLQDSLVRQDEILQVLYLNVQLEPHLERSLLIQYNKLGYCNLSMCWYTFRRVPSQYSLN